MGSEIVVFETEEEALLEIVAEALVGTGELETEMLPELELVPKVLLGTDEEGLVTLVETEELL